jgi:hypothetical protein
LTPSLPTATEGHSYTGSVTASGGVSPYTWTVNTTPISSGSVTLSNGLSAALNASGTVLNISGTPTTTAPVTVDVAIADSQGTPATQTSDNTITVTSFAITTTTLSPTYAIVGGIYSDQLAASGGSGSYSWAVTTNNSGLGALGLSLNSSTGVLSNTSTLAAGSATFTVTVTDTTNTSLTATQSYSITVYSALALTPNPNPLSTFTSNQSYNGTITVSGGSGSYASFQVNDGSGLQTVPADQQGNIVLTSGFTVAMNHDYELIIGGTPTITTALQLAVTVTDSLSNVITQTFTISPASSTMTVTLNDVPQGMVGMPYTYSGPSISGGSGSYTVAYTNAPDGLSKDTATNNLVGTPTTASTGTTVTVKVTDTSSPAQTVTKMFVLPVVAQTVGDHNSYLKGQYACSLQHYWDGGVTGGDGHSTLYRGGVVFAIAVNGNGGITGGKMDMNSPESGYTSVSSLSGTYAVGEDNRGYLLLTVGSGSGVMALAGGNLNSSNQFSDFAVTEMDDAGPSADASGQHGSGHCYQQTTTSLSGIWPTGGYVFALTGEDSSGYSESMVGSIQYTAGSSSSAGTITGVMDMVDYQTLSPDVTLTGTTPKGTGTDSYGRITMTAGPSISEENTTVMYLTNNAKGQVLLMGTQAHNGSSDADFLIGEARKQVAANVKASYPLSGNGILYVQGTKYPSGSTPVYKAQVAQFTGSSSADSITINSTIQNNDGTFAQDATTANGGITGASMAYVVGDTTTGRTTITGQSGISFYLYNTDSAAVLFADTGKSGSIPNNLTGWIEPQTAPTSGTWAVSNFAASYFMYKIENGNYEGDTESMVLTVGSSGSISGFASDSGGQNWASWDEGMTDENGNPVTAAVALDTTTNGATTDGAYGLFDINFTEGGNTATESYCFAASVDTATVSTTKGRLVCLDASSSNPRIMVLQQ